MVDGSTCRVVNTGLTMPELCLCDSCGDEHPIDDLTYLVERAATRIDPEEGVLICDDCLGEEE